MKNNLVAVIPVRAGSQRVKNKNFRPFCGTNLLQLKIDQIKKLPVDRIIVNTDSEIAVSIAKDNGIEYFIRDKYFASSECLNSEYHKYLGLVTESDNILIAQVTNPLIHTNSYLEGIEKFFHSKCDSLMSVTKFKNFLIHEEKPFNFLKGKMPNSQDLPEYRIPTFGIVICNRECLIEDENYMCGKTYYYEISQEESVDIDTEFDFRIAELLFGQRSNA